MELINNNLFNSSFCLAEKLETKMYEYQKVGRNLNMKNSMIYT